jgi:hypothetical protein
MKTNDYVYNILNKKLINNDKNLVKHICSYLKCKYCNRLNLSKKNICICSYKLCMLCKINDKKTYNYLICDKMSFRWLNHQTSVLCKNCYDDIKRKKNFLPSDFILKCDICNQMICTDCRCHKSEFYTYCYDCYYN